MNREPACLSHPALHRITGLLNYRTTEVPDIPHLDDSLTDCPLTPALSQRARENIIAALNQPRRLQYHRA